MSCYQHVYVGAAVRIDSAPENYREIIEGMPGERLWQPYDGNEESVPYLLPNVACDCGVTYTKYGEARTIGEITNATIADAVALLYDTFRDDLFYLSDNRFAMTVVYVALDYWL